MTTVVTPESLGEEFDLGVEEAGKIHLKVDGATVFRDAVSGIISAVGGGSDPTYRSQRVITASGPVADTDDILNVNNGGALLTLTFPPAATCPGKVLTVRRYDSSSIANININGGGTTIESTLGNGVYAATASFTNTTTMRRMTYYSGGGRWNLLHNA